MELLNLFQQKFLKTVVKFFHQIILIIERNLSRFIWTMKRPFDIDDFLIIDFKSQFILSQSIVSPKNMVDDFNSKTSFATQMKCIGDKNLFDENLLLNILRSNVVTNSGILRKWKNGERRKIWKNIIFNIS